MSENITPWAPPPKGYLSKEIDTYKRPEAPAVVTLLAAVGWLFIIAALFEFLSESTAFGFASAVSGLLMLGFSAAIRR